MANDFLTTKNCTSSLNRNMHTFKLTLHLYFFFIYYLLSRDNFCHLIVLFVFYDANDLFFSFVYFGLNFNKKRDMLLFFVVVVVII